MEGVKACAALYCSSHFHLLLLTAINTLNGTNGANIMTTPAEPHHDDTYCISLSQPP